MISLLTPFVLSGCVQISPLGLQDLAETAVNLNRINVTSCRLLTTDVLRQYQSRWQYVEGTSQLENLDMLGPNIAEATKPRFLGH